MLIVICGEDSISAFNYYSLLKKNYKEKNYEIFEINANEIENIDIINQSSMLFSSKKIFFTKDLNKKISKKINLKINKIVEDIIKEKNIEVIDYEEEIQGRMLKFSKNVIIKEFKPSENIFKLQESIYPGNLKNFIRILNKVSESSDEYFIFNMIVKHIRNLILTKEKIFDKKLKSWQIAKLTTQLLKWDKEKLISFYQGLYKIDLQQKTSSTPYSVKKSLEVLSCYYL
ncbi:MAG: hypothetical protein N2593_02925 [Patescibacteria group bacterium]|nr:hypothetical protein [Patescibacteria group bacterium]